MTLPRRRSSRGFETRDRRRVGHWCAAVVCCVRAVHAMALTAAGRVVPDAVAVVSFSASTPHPPPASSPSTPLSCHPQPHPHSLTLPSPSLPDHRQHHSSSPQVTLPGLRDVGRRASALADGGGGQGCGPKWLLRACEGALQRLHWAHGVAVVRALARGLIGRWIVVAL